MLASNPSAARSNPGPAASGTLTGAPAPTAAAATEASLDLDQERLHFDKLGTPIVARVTQRDADGLTLRQALPFLELDGLLTDGDGRRATLASVGIIVRDGVPHLELEVRYTGSDDPTIDLAARLFPADGPSSRRDPTVPYALPNPDIAMEIQLDAADLPATPMTPLASPAPARRWWHRALVALQRLTARFR